MAGVGVPKSRLKQFGFTVKRELFTYKKELDACRYFRSDLSVNTRNCEITITDQMLVVAKDLQTQYEKALDSAIFLGKDTPVLMADGSIRAVQLIKDGDIVMGPDSRPRLVSNVTQGVGRLFKVTPTKGESWVCNENHVLTVCDIWHSAVFCG